MGNWAVTTSSASSLTLATSNDAYVFTGTAAATWTLPAVSGNTGVNFYLYNRGSARVTVHGAGSDDLYNRATVMSIYLEPGTAATLLNDGTYWLVRRNTQVPQTYYVDDYGADPTGTNSSNTAVANAVAAMGSNPGVLEFGPGDYLLSATTTLGAYQSIRGQGRGVTTITFTGTGDCFRVWDQTSRADVPPTVAGPIEGFTIEGSGAGANSSGLHIGDLFGAQVRDVLIADFAAPGCIGLWFDNYIQYFERGDISAVVNNCTDCVVFDVHGGDPSFSYSIYNLWMFAYANQNGVVIRNTAVLAHTKLTIFGNFFNCTVTPSGGGVRGGWTPASTNTGVALIVGTTSSDYANIERSELNVVVENGGVVGNPTTRGHYTIQVGASAGIQANGLLDFQHITGFTWQNATLSGYFVVAGRTNVDSVAGTTADPQSLTFTGALTTPANGGAVYGGVAYLGTGNFFLVNLVSGNNTLTFNVPAGQTGYGIYEFVLFQPGSGPPGTVTWPPNLYWFAGTAPTLSTNNDSNLIRVYTWDQSNFFGYLAV
jgi:hypothetical protein